MKTTLLIALLAITSLASAQDRGRGIQRVEDRQQNNSYVYHSTYQQADYHFSRMNLSYYQKKQLIDLLDQKELEAKKVRRRYANAKNHLIKIERDFDYKLSRLLNRSQYQTWLRYYADDFRVDINKYRYI